MHALGEILLILGRGFAVALLLGQFIVEAIFPHLNRNRHRHPDELILERQEEERRAKQEAAERKALEERIHADAKEEAAYINSLKLGFAHRKEFLDDAFFAEEHNKRIDEMEAGSKDPEKDLAVLRKNAVEAEQLRLQEIRRNERRKQLKRESDYHVSEKIYWRNRADSEPDSEEKARCERQSDYHRDQARYANTARTNT
jgi:hypothetical protein